MKSESLFVSLKLVLRHPLSESEVSVQSVVFPVVSKLCVGRTPDYNTGILTDRLFPHCNLKESRYARCHGAFADHHQRD